MQFARGPRRKDDFSGPQDRNIPRPRRTIYRMQITGLQPDTSWQVSKLVSSSFLSPSAVIIIPPRPLLASGRSRQCGI